MYDAMILGWSRLLIGEILENVGSIYLIGSSGYKPNTIWNREYYEIILFKI